MRMIHSTFHNGSKIRLIFKSGGQIIAKFKANRKGQAIITDKGEFLIKDIRCANYYKPLPHER